MVVSRLLLFAAALAPGAVQAKCQVGRLAELNVTMVGEQPTVEIGINGRPLRFMVDSGAFSSIISPSTAKELGLSLSSLPPGFQVRGIGGESSAWLARVKSMTLAGIPLHDVPFIVGGSETGPSAGVLGQNVLGVGDVEYDLGHGAIRLLKSRDCGKLGLAYWAATRPFSTLAIEPRSATRPHTIGTVTLNGARVRATFDSGASGTTLSLAAAARAGVRPDSPGVVPGTAIGGFGKRLVKTWIAPFDVIDIGGEQLHHVKLRIGDIGLDNTDMLIGIDFFLSHRIYVANAQQKMFFTYEGGPLFNIAPKRVVDSTGAVLALPAEAEPTDADGLSRRGMAFAARNEWQKADADLSRAIALAPANGHYYYQRATIRMRERQPGAAHDDLDRALELAPDDAEALMMRARLRLMAHDRPAASGDIAAVDRLLPAASDLRLALGVLYGEIDAYERAIAQFDGWLHIHPEDNRKPEALNSRAWFRALANKELPAALSDVDAALRSRRDNPSFRDTRGLVRLRMGDYAQAVADYTAGIATAPKSAWSLYGRAVAERHLGQEKAAAADTAAALAIAPHIDERFRALGIN